jgi:hypothetical protein
MNRVTIGLLLAIVSTLSLIVALLAVRPIGEVRRISPGAPAVATAPAR